MEFKFELAEDLEVEGVGPRLFFPAGLSGGEAMRSGSGDRGLLGDCGLSLMLDMVEEMLFCRLSLVRGFFEGPAGPFEVTGDISDIFFLLVPFGFELDFDGLRTTVSIS